MKNLFSTLENELAAGRDTMMVTVVAGSGSVPRGAGARMLVGANGRIEGTIGGGAVEHRAEQLAVEALTQKHSYIRPFTLRRNEVEDLGMICGGDVKVFIQYVPAGAENRAFARQVADCFDGGANAWLLYDITDETAWQMALYVDGRGLVATGRAPDGAARGLEGLDAEALGRLLLSAPVQRETDDGRLVYAEPVAYAGRVLVFGGGHVSQELVPVLSRVGFRCVVFDDRPDFTTGALFPQAVERITAPFGDIAASLAIGPGDYVVVMTRGHASDFEVQRQVLAFPSAYVGVIGSRTKIKAVSQRLLDAGVSQADIDRIHTPIGLAIKAQTPAEIAVSIAAEMILVRAQLAEAAVKSVKQ